MKKDLRPMRHLIICPEYRPAPIPSGGIGTYVRNIARLLAEAGETVHVIGTLWEGAPEPVEELVDGRLIIHRVPNDRPLDVDWNRGREALAQDEVNWLSWSAFPGHGFAMQAALYAEKLIDEESIDAVEAQEYDAPLYYFQLRRSIGLGPKRKPPCVVHIHSPTELIFRHNDWNMAREDVRYAVQMEAFSIRSADFRLCPSRYLARQSEEIYGLDRDAVTTIPLPVGDTPRLDRDIDVWRDGTICYVGRLEPRKGVIEWIEAAVAVANDFPGLRFELIGADLPYGEGRSVQQLLETRIPEHQRSQFAFRGNLSRDELMDHLARARIAAVPSRWENFPNTCVEAMRTGLPVLVSRNGGMTEMIEHGRSGWVADSQEPEGLERALRRALETPALELATMGQNAADRIDAVCNNDEILRKHLAFRRKVVAPKERRRRPWYSERVFRTPAKQPEIPAAPARPTVVIATVENPYLLEECIDRVYEQGIEPSGVTVVIDEAGHRSCADYLARFEAAGCHVIRQASKRRAAMWNSGLAFAARKTGPRGSVLLMDERDRLLSACVDSMHAVLEDRDDVDLVSAWVKVEEKIVPRLSPAFPDQLIENAVDTPALLRLPSASAGDVFDTTLLEGYELWGLANRLLVAKRAVIVYPQTLAERFRSKPPARSPERRRMHRQLLASVEDIVRSHALAVAELLDARRPAVSTSSREDKKSRSGEEDPDTRLPTILRPSDLFRLTWKERYAVGKAAIRKPRHAYGFLAWHTKNAVSRLVSRNGK
jgi:glycosyltransferase involved in cell wall biosynthesis